MWKLYLIILYWTLGSKWVKMNLNTLSSKWHFFVSKSFELICPCPSVISFISLYIGHSLVNNYPLANLPSKDSASHRFFPLSVSTFNYRVWRDFRTSQHIGGLEYIIRSAILCLFSVLFIFSILQYCINPPRSIFTLGHMVWSRRVPPIHQPVCVSIIFKQM